MKSTKEMLAEIDSIKSRITTLEKALSSPSYSLDFPEMIKIPNRSYSLGKYPVTVGQWKAFFQDVNNVSFYDNPVKSGNNPITSITYKEVQEYITWLNTRTSQTYRLPTEDEWEYCSADHKEATEETAVFNQSSISPVGTKTPNSFGLYDMLGNVWEITSSSQNSSDGCPKFIVIRGGSCYSGAWDYYAAYRDFYDPSCRNVSLGFRLLRED